MKDEALKSVLEVLKAAYVPADLDEQREKAIAACEQALAAPVQKPYAYANPNELSADSAFRWCETNKYTMPVYTAAQRQWVGLTDEQRNEIWSSYRVSFIAIDVIEAKLKEKNT